MSKRIVPGTDAIRLGEDGTFYAGSIQFPPSPSPIGRMKFWEGTAIDGTAQTIIPNATGDVTEAITFVYTASEITGTEVSGGVVTMEPNSSFVVVTDGTNSLTLTCAADGSVTIARSAGADTYKFAAMMVWL